MLHMQHAHVVALLVRQHEAALLKAERDTLARARRAAAAAGLPEAQPAATRGARTLHRPRPA